MRPMASAQFSVNRFWVLDLRPNQPDIAFMATPNLPAATPSLEQAFQPERDALIKALSQELSAAQTVGAARAALDKAGARFVKSVEDPQLQKAGLWLLEMIKSGAGVLDRASQAEILYVETQAPKSFLSLIRPSLFYGAASVLLLAGILQGSVLTMVTAGVLGLLHTLDPMRFQRLKNRLPFLPKPKTIEDHTGRHFKAEAQIVTDAHGFVAQLSDAFKIADHILLRLSTQHDDAHWSDDTRLMGLFQNLLEAGHAQDDHFAMRVIETELPSFLSGEGVELLEYSAQNDTLFDRLPAMGTGPDFETAAPALINKDGRVLRRGTVWVRS